MGKWASVAVSGAIREPINDASHRRRRPDPERLAVDDAIARVADGDHDAFADLYDHLSSRMFGVICSVVIDRARSEEVLQNVMIEIWRIAPSCDPGRGTGTGWALSVAHRRAIDCVRSEMARRGRDTWHLDNLTLLEPPEIDPADEAVNGERRFQVRAALESLPESQRTPIELAFYGGLTHTQIADCLCWPLGTVKSRVRAGLIALGNALTVD